MLVAAAAATAAATVAATVAATAHVAATDLDILRPCLTQQYYPQ